MQNKILKIAQQARQASFFLANVPAAKKNRLLKALASLIMKNSRSIISRNNLDVKFARKMNLSEALIDRLILDEKRIAGMCGAVTAIAQLPDPVGEVISQWKTSLGMKIQKVRAPIGVIAMVYESRPNVTVDSAALCLKSGNAVILRGGKETINTNRFLVDIIRKAISKEKLPADAVQFIDTPDRNALYELARLDQYVDLMILRGGENMIRNIKEASTVPVIAHGKGLCHTYIDKDADISKAVKIAYNAKVQRPGVCNAMETLLIHRDIAGKVLPQLVKKYAEAGVELRGCSKTSRICRGIKSAKEQDWSTEYLGLILSIKIVDSMDDAIRHISRYGSKHSESIVTNNRKTAEKFLNRVDASAVFHNASTRLHDGGIFGFGAEIGISTQKLHARGVMGLKDLTTTKYKVYGSGQTR